MVIPPIWKKLPIILAVIGAVGGAAGILTPSLSLDDLADCDLVIEAVYESMDIKKEVFGKLDTICKPGAILASNTS